MATASNTIPGIPVFFAFAVKLDFPAFMPDGGVYVSVKGGSVSFDRISTTT